ncbi:MAG: aspartate/glutamate racemase family protein [Gammaproteobacteria bacterium]|nr:aspartate/glutamate racemase family protein [Gammaproteobacteria bacterium]
MAQAVTSRDNQPLIRNHIPYELDGGVAERASIGVIVLASDQTIEHEFRLLLDLPGVAFYESRIYCDNIVTPESLSAMEPKIGPSAALILPGMPLDVVAFGCTSASMIIGESRVFEKIQRVRPGAKCTTPVTAAFAAFEALGAKRIAILTPYREDVNERVRQYVESRGYDVRAIGSFNEEDDSRAARIELRYIRDAAVVLGRQADVDMVFVSCTSLRLATIAAEIEAEIGKPVSSSNHALAWHCLRLGGVEDVQPGFGKLYTLSIHK